MNKTKILSKDIVPDTIKTNITILNDNGLCSYILRVIFRLKDRSFVQTTIEQVGVAGEMNFICREETGEYISHLKYEFNLYIFKKFLKKMFNSHIKDLSDKEMIDPYEVIDIINKIRNNYVKCTSVLSIGDK